MESFLNSTYKAAAPATEPLAPVYMAIDIGSTQTRSCIFNKKFEWGTDLLLDSNYEVLSRDIVHVASPNDKVESALEMIIKDLSAGSKTRPVFTELHIVKGELLRAISNMRHITASSSSKVDQEATYINIISNIGIKLLEHYQTTGSQVEAIDVRLTVALPPEDTRFKQRMETFKQRLAGTYSVNFIRLGCTVTFNIPSNINIISEPEAVAVYHSVNTNDDDDEKDTTLCVLDIGGRSTGITFIDNGQLLTDSCVTVPIGGSNLLSLVGRRISESFNIQEPIPDRLYSVLKTGVFRMGAQKVDVTELINDAKREFASSIFNELVRAIDLNRIQMQCISYIICSGGTFGEAPGSPSLMEPLSEMFKVRSAYTLFTRITEDNPILRGIVYHGMLYA